jgi:pimeloyl-ACP methyl ester carboxylesterase
MSRGLTLVVAALFVLAFSGSAAGGAPRWNYWLCFPGAANDWCAVELTTTVISADGSRKTVPVSVPDHPPIDCFYVYPTVSEERRGNATLKVHPEERETAITQAARFSHVCRVYAPLYRQTTAYRHQYNGNPQLAYNDVVAAWKDYLAHYNKGRGVVLIGHSQGAGVLARLIREHIDNSPTVRKRLVSAILLGGGVEVTKGSTTGDFKHVPACASMTETGCVIAYEAWDRTPPAGDEVSSAPARQPLCVNPAAPGSTKAVPIRTIFAGINPQGIVPYGSVYVTYHWVEFPGLYTAQCVEQGRRSWLLVSRIKKPGDHRPTVYEALGPDSGLHAADVNITLGNLVDLVASQSRAWLAHR